MNLGQQLRAANVAGALKIVDSLPTKDGIPRYSRNKELSKWQAAAWILAREVRAVGKRGEHGD